MADKTICPLGMGYGQSLQWCEKSHGECMNMVPSLARVVLDHILTVSGLHLVYFPYIFLLTSPFYSDILQFFFFYVVKYWILTQDLWQFIKIPRSHSENMMQYIRLVLTLTWSIIICLTQFQEREPPYVTSSPMFQTINRCQGPANLGHWDS